jgi:opacity protein-like surface antigen
MGIVDYPGAGRTYFATVRYEFGGQNSSDDVPSERSGLLGDNAVQKDSSFYVASKVFYSKMHTSLSGENLTFGGGPDGTRFNPSPLYPNIWAYWFPAGASFTQPMYGGNTSPSGMAAGLATGIDFYKRFNIPIRLELEGDLHTRLNLEYGENWFLSDIDDLDEYYGKQNLQATLSSIFFNAYLDFHNRTRLTPYVGAGIGALRYHFKLTQDFYFLYYGPSSSVSLGNANTPVRSYQKIKGWDLTWNLSAGFAYQMTPSTHIDLSYRYINFGEQRIDVAIPSEFYRRVGSSKDWIIAYGSGTGQTINMEMHQAVLSFRFDLGASQETVAEFDRKKAAGLKMFGSLSGPGLLERPAIRAGSFSISPRIGLYLPDKKFGLEDGYVAGLSLGYNVTGNWGVEATVDMSNHLNDTSGKTYSGVARVGSARLNAVYHIVDPNNELSRWVPYATAGIGMVWATGHFKTVPVYVSGITDLSYQPTGNYSSIAVNAGLGMKYFLNQNVALRVEAVDTFAFRDADFQRDVGPYHNLAVTGGLTFQFGGVQ